MELCVFSFAAEWQKTITESLISSRGRIISGGKNRELLLVMFRNFVFFFFG